MNAPALLALADGNVFRGLSVGAEGRTVGEVVFNTAMTGYQEILTDPSYAQQIVTLTYPHVGNTGCNAVDEESTRVHAAGLVIRDLPRLASNWRSSEPLGQYLRRHGIVAIADIDTRRLTRILRDSGAQNGCILAGANLAEEQAFAAARAFPGLKGMDLAKVVTTQEKYTFDSGSYDLDRTAFASLTRKRRIVAYDFGVKRNILRMLVDRGCEVIVVPAQTSASDALAMKPDGVFLSNGPGDPEPCDYAIAADARIHQTANPAVRYLPRPPDSRSRRWRKDAEDEIRPSRRQSSGYRTSQRTSDDFKSKSWFRGRRSDVAACGAGYASFVVRSIQPRHSRRRRTGVQFSGAPRSQPRPARCGRIVR